MSEHKIQYQISQYLNAKKVLHFTTDVMSGLQYFSHKDPRRFAFINHHKKSGYVVGQSDFIVVMQNKCYFVELKTEKGKQSKEQKIFQERVESLGFEYLVWRSLDDAINFLE